MQNKKIGLNDLIQIRQEQLKKMAENEIFIETGLIICNLKTNKYSNYFRKTFTFFSYKISYGDVNFLKESFTINENTFKYVFKNRKIFEDFFISEEYENNIKKISQFFKFTTEQQDEIKNVQTIYERIIAYYNWYDRSNVNETL